VPKSTPNRYLRLALPVAAVIGLATPLSLTHARGRGVTLKSPDGRVVFDVDTTGNGQLSYRIALGRTAVIEPSPIVVIVDGTDIGAGAQLGKVETYEGRARYPWRGVHLEASDHHRGARIAVAHQASGTRYTLDARAFDDGIAFRYVVPGSSAPRLVDERTLFTIPAGSAVWYHDFENHYESMHAQKEASQILAGEWAAPPVTIELPDGKGYAAITEGGLAAFSGMGLQANGQRGLEVRLGHAQPLNYPFKLRYGEDEGKRLSNGASIAGTITSPWRVVLVGSNLDALVNSDIVHNVSAEPDKRLFPEGMNTPWVKPGRSLWRYLDGGDNSFEGMKEFARYANQLGFEYNLLEGFWQRWPVEQLKELVDYSRTQGVGIWLWKHSKDLRDPAARKGFFDLCRDVGAAGVKIDFFDHEHKEVVELYAVMLREAAERRILVNFHGANKPAGESRTWPNELTREAVYGMERGRTVAWSRHNTVLPFTRYLAGHADYTGVVFGERRKETSWAHQIATAAVFTSPLLVYGGHPKSLMENPAVEMIKSIPPAWDETRVLPASRIGEVAVFARRRGNDWFLAVLNGPTARALKIPLSFLPAGQHQTLVVGDKPEAADAVDVRTERRGKDDTLSIDLRAGGGFIAKFSR
jgi:alpha-glucosidase